MSSMINKLDNSWYICTDGEKVFHLIKNQGQLTTAQPYVVKAESEDEVINKVFKNSPTRNEQGVYNVDNLTPRSKSVIIGYSDKTI